MFPPSSLPPPLVSFDSVIQHKEDPLPVPYSFSLLDAISLLSLFVHLRLLPLPFLLLPGLHRLGASDAPELPNTQS